MSRTRRTKQKHKKKGNKLRYLTFVVVIFAVAGLGIFFYMNNFQSTLLPLLGSVKGNAPASAWTATLCFGDETGRNLIEEHRIISSAQSPEKKAEALLKELLKGPISRGTRTLPQHTHGLRFLFKQGVLTVDFSPELRTNHPGGSAAELLTVYSIVNTMTMNIPEVRRVQIMIEGRAIDNIAGHVDCREPIAPRLDILQ